MKICITGGSGFIGSHLAHELVAEGHHVVLIMRLDRLGDAGDSLPPGDLCAIGLGDEKKLSEALTGCDAIAHCAGINREIGGQTYDNVHIDGTRKLIIAARNAKVKKLVFLSFLRARPACGSRYHESKWAAEELIRESGLDYTILKPGVIYGRGDHMLDHLSHAFYTFPLFALVGMKDQLIRPIAVTDITRILRAALIDGRLSRQTVAVTGPEEMTLRAAVVRVASIVNRRPYMFRMPIFFHYAFGWVLEQIMRTPLVALAQVRILSEGIVEPLPPCNFAPDDLRPKQPFTEAQIRRGLPAPGPFGIGDLRFCGRAK